MTDERRRGEFREAFLKANANLDYIAAQFADVIRDLMRAVGSDQPSAEAYRAAEKMNTVAELLSYSEEGFSFYEMFQRALREFDKPDDMRMDVDEAVLDAARCGIKYVVEDSCNDNAARGRTSRRRQEFLSAVKYIDEVREYYRRKHRDG
jgi:hypothetical protein